MIRPRQNGERDEMHIAIHQHYPVNWVVGVLHVETPASVAAADACCIALLLACFEVDAVARGWQVVEWPPASTRTAI